MQVKIRSAESSARVAAGHVVAGSSPDVASVTVQETVTSPSYQPLLPRVPVGTAVTDGGVASLFTVVASDAVPPALVALAGGGVRAVGGEGLVEAACGRGGGLTVGHRPVDGDVLRYHPLDPSG